MSDAKRQLRILAEEHQFTVRRNCCYRKKGDGILQLLKFEYEPRLMQHILYIGLYSLYSEISAHALSPNGCILHYPIVNLHQTDDNACISPVYQISMLRNTGMQWLDAMYTQQDLIDAMCGAEIHLNGKIIWGDRFKLAPFLFLGKRELADRVIAAILQQHVGPQFWTTSAWTDSDFQMYSLRYPGEDEQLLRIHNWIASGNSDAIEIYLRKNFHINSEIIKLN